MNAAHLVSCPFLYRLLKRTRSKQHRNLFLCTCNGRIEVRPIKDVRLLDEINNFIELGPLGLVSGNSVCQVQVNPRIILEDCSTIRIITFEVWWYDLVLVIEVNDECIIMEVNDPSNLPIEQIKVIIVFGPNNLVPPSELGYFNVPVLILTMDFYYRTCMVQTLLKVFVHSNGSIFAPFIWNDDLSTKTSE